MKKGLALFLTVLTIFGCTKKSELEQKREELSEKNTELHALKGEIEILHNEIEKLDTTETEEIYDVYVSKVSRTEFSSYVDIQGVVKTDNNVTIMAESNGVIQKIYVKEGEKVKAGQVLAKIDDAILRRNLQELETNLELAESLFQKQKRLRDQNVGTEIQFLEAKNRRDGLISSKATLNAQLAKSTIKSPIEGKIDEIFPNKGEMANPAAPFARIVSTNNLYINADVSEAFYQSVDRGDEIEAYFSNTDERVSLKISYKGNYINPGNRTFKVQAPLSGGDYPPNTILTVRIRDKHIKDAMVIPTKALQSDLKGYYVYKIDGTRAKKVYVKIGASYDSQSVIKEGLSKGDQLVIKGYRSLSEDAKVKINK